MLDLDAVYVLSDARQVERLFILIKGNYREFADKGHPLMVHLMPEHARRSLEQNRTYWRLLAQISEEAWIESKQFSKDAFHEYFRRLFLPQLEGPSGELYPVSTTSLSVREFSEYVGRIEAFAATDLGIEL